MDLLLGLVLSIILKPAVLILSGWLVIRFWRKRGEEAGFKLFSIALTFFFLGELFCAIDVYIIGAMTTLNESLHDLGMSISFSIFILGIWDRLISRGHCFRTNCELYTNCKLHPADCSIFPVATGIVPWTLIGLSILGGLASVATTSQTSGTIPAGYGDTLIGEYLFSRSDFLVLLQHRILPLSSVLLMLTSAIILFLYGTINRSIAYLISFGVGILAFVYFRLMIIQLYNPNLLWTGLAEEILELIFVIYVWMIFQRRL